jgi:TPR repeat protein
MKKLITLLLTALLLFASSSNAAGALEDAAKAYEAKNYTQAIKLYKPLALKGNENAQFSLGIMYNEGKGVPQDYAEAVKWFKLAAEQNGVRVESRFDKLAMKFGALSPQYYLGIMYREGHGVTQDYAIAHMWFNLAAALGYKDAGEMRDKISKKMTEHQIAEAQKLARECLARNYKGC